MIRKPLGRWSAAASAVFFFPRLMRCPRRRASVAATPLARSVMATRADPEKLPAPKRAPAEPPCSVARIRAAAFAGGHYGIDPADPLDRRHLPCVLRCGAAFGG